MTKIIRRTAPVFRKIEHAAPALSALSAQLPTTRELGADYHWLLGTDNANDLCQITGKKLHPNIRGYIADGGSAYTVAPTITLPNGAAGSVLLSSSGIWSFTLTAGGAGYPAATQITVNVTGGTYAPGGRAPRYKVVGVSGGVITAVSQLDPGVGVLAPPTVSFSAASGSGAAMTLAITSGVRRIDVTAGGSGYTAPPLVTLTGGTSGSSLAARAIAQISGGAVTAIWLLEGGFGYTSVPAVSFSGGGGTGATATAVLGAQIVRAIVISDPGAQTGNITATFSGGDGSGASGGALVSTAVVTRSANSLTIPAGGTTDNNAQNGLVIPGLLDLGEHTVFVVAKITNAATGQIVMGSTTNGASTYGGFDLRYTSANGYQMLDYNVQLTATSVPLPAGATNGTWVQFAHADAPVAGASVTPSASTVQSYELYTRAGAATPVTVSSGERKAVTRPRMIGVGNCYQYGTTFRTALEIAEVIVFKRKLSAAEIDAVRARSTARLAVRGITLVNS